MILFPPVLAAPANCAQGPSEQGGLLYQTVRLHLSTVVHALFDMVPAYMQVRAAPDQQHACLRAARTRTLAAAVPSWLHRQRSFPCCWSTMACPVLPFPLSATSIASSFGSFRLGARRWGWS